MIYGKRMYFIICNTFIQNIVNVSRYKIELFREYFVDKKDNCLSYIYWSSRPVLCITNSKPIATISSNAEMSAKTIAPVDSTPYEGLGPIHLLNVDTHSGSSFRSSFVSSDKNESGDVVQRK